jgi:hypothetical protein
VEDALRAIGQTIASLGATDQRLICPRLLDYCPSQQLAGYHHVNPAPTCVTLASLRLIDYAYQVAITSPSTMSHATVDMAYIGFFYLNRPGEYFKLTASDSLSAPFHL